MAEQQFHMLTLEGRDGKKRCVKFATVEDEDDKKYALELHRALDALFRHECGYTLGPVVLDATCTMYGPPFGPKCWVEGLESADKT